MQTIKPALLQQEAVNTGENTLMSDPINTNIVKERFDLTKMVPLSEVSRFAWDIKKAKRLRTLRGETSRRNLVEKLKELNCDYSHQYLHNLESGEGESIAASLLLAICEVFEVDLSYFIPTARIETDITRDV